MTAFGHALKLGLSMTSDLTILHVDPLQADPDFENFPRVRATLSRWGGCSGKEPPWRTF